jgi:MtN3 and saliva related transmembrane protein
MDINVFKETIGTIGAIMTTFAFFPQTVKIFTTKKADDVSLWMLIIMIMGLTFMLILGLHINSFQLILANAFSIIVNVSTLFFKIFYTIRKV